LTLPRSLQALLEEVEYPPIPQAASNSQITKIVMIVEAVSPTPFALLRRARNFEYRSDDDLLQQFSNFDDPTQALTDECKRVLLGIATANDSSNTKMSTSLKDPEWSRFEDIGFSGMADEPEQDLATSMHQRQEHEFSGLRSTPHSKLDAGRPTTPSWADFLSTGFANEPKRGPTSLLPPDKRLPPMNMRGHSSHSARPAGPDTEMGAGELASIRPVDIDDVFWWVWITSLSGEETLTRKSTFGRCALIETKLRGNVWLLMEEVVKGAKAEPAAQTYVAEKKRRFGFGKRKTSEKVPKLPADANGTSSATGSPLGRKAIAPDQHARIQAAAAALSQRQMTPAKEKENDMAGRRGRADDGMQSRTASVLTLQPVIVSAAGPGMKWASSYDKDTIRAQYLGDQFAGKGGANDLPSAIAEAKAKELGPDGSAPLPPPKDGMDVQNAQSVQAVQKPVASQTHPQRISSVQPLDAPSPGVTRTPSPGTQLAQQPPSQALAAAAALTPVASRTNVAAAPMQSAEDWHPRPMERVEPSKSGAVIDKSDAGARLPMPPRNASTDDFGPESPGSLPTGRDGKGGRAENGKLVKRKNVPNRFNSIFGRKKADDLADFSGVRANGKDVKGTANGNSNRLGPPAAPSSSNAVAAARAALEAKAQQAAPSPSPQAPPTKAKRASVFGDGRQTAPAPAVQARGPGPRSTALGVPAGSAAPPANGVSPMTKSMWAPGSAADLSSTGDATTTATRPHEPSSAAPQAPSAAGTAPELWPNTGRSHEPGYAPDDADAGAAAREFARFDQGPLDAPAFGYGAEQPSRSSLVSTESAGPTPHGGEPSAPGAGAASAASGPVTGMHVTRENVPPMGVPQRKAPPGADAHGQHFLAQMRGQNGHRIGNGSVQPGPLPGKSPPQQGPAVQSHFHEHLSPQHTPPVEGPSAVGHSFPMPSMDRAPHAGNNVQSAGMGVGAGEGGREGMMGEEEEGQDGLSKVDSGGSYDRWAQIRRNAADRLATRQSEDRSRRTTGTSASGLGTEDEGASEGEESTSEFHSSRVRC